jgi:membrane protease YdiL (CAAX protease family)
VPTEKWLAASISLIVAAILWILVFLIRPFDFWLMLSLSTLILLSISVLVNGNSWPVNVNVRMVLLGVISAVLLYGFFFLGFQATRSSPIFSQGVSSVYEFKSSQPVLVIGLLLLFPIGPGEELYWRGLIQRRFSEKFGSGVGYIIAATAYALVHLPTLNFPLILTAFIGGLVWGYIYKATGNLVPAVVSHVLWDLLIFVIVPLS